MPQLRKILGFSVAGFGAAAVLFAAPASADTSLIPQCEGTGGATGQGGGTTVCASEGNSQIVATPRVMPGEGDEFYGFPGFGFI